MTLDADTWLLIGAIGFYLYDSIRLIPSNHAVLIRSFSKWSITIPKGFLSIRGRRLYLPNPFAPFRAIFSVQWSDRQQDIVQSGTTSLFVLAEHLKSLQAISAILFLEMFLLLPAIAISSGLGTQFIAALLLVYSTICLEIYELYKNKVGLGLNKKTLASIAFDCIACPPFAVNVVRKVSKNSAINIDLIKFAKENFDTDVYESFAINLGKEISDIVAYDDLDSSDAAKLVSLQKSLDSNNQ